MDGQGGSKAPYSDMRWLRFFYKENGWNYARVRKDVLDFAAKAGFVVRTKEFDALTFGDLVHAYAWCLHIADMHHKAGAANQGFPRYYFGPVNGSEEVTAEQAALPYLALRPLREKDLPRVNWRPFSPISRPRAWTHTELIAALKRGVQRR